MCSIKSTLTSNSILATAIADAEAGRSLRHCGIDLRLIGRLHQPISTIQSEASQKQEQHRHAQLGNGLTLNHPIIRLDHLALA